MEEGTDQSILGDHRVASTQQYVPGTKGPAEFETDQVFPVEITKYLCLKRHDKAVSEYHVQLQFSLLKKGELKPQQNHRRVTGIMGMISLSVRRN